MLRSRRSRPHLAFHKTLRASAKGQACKQKTKNIVGIDFGTTTTAVAFKSLDSAQKLFSQDHISQTIHMVHFKNLASQVPTKMAYKESEWSSDGPLEQIWGSSVDDEVRDRNVRADDVLERLKVALIGDQVRTHKPALDKIKEQLERLLINVPNSTHLETSNNSKQTTIDDLIADYLRHVLVYTLGEMSRQQPDLPWDTDISRMPLVQFNEDIVPFLNEHFSFVIGVPGIWSPELVQRTVEAARAAGMTDIYPVSESICGAYFTAQQHYESNSSQIAPGTTFILSDQGGLTHDTETLTFRGHAPLAIEPEISGEGMLLLFRGLLSYLTSLSGNFSGGISVNMAFRRLAEADLGPFWDAIVNARRAHTNTECTVDQILDSMEAEFEDLKKRFDGEQNLKVYIDGLPNGRYLHYSGRDFTALDDGVLALDRDGQIYMPLHQYVQSTVQ